MADMPYIILIAHGSRRQQANQEVETLAQRLAQRLKGDYGAVRPAFLELADPSIPAAIDQCVAEGARRLILLPYFLSEGRHVSEDIPALVAERRERYPAVEIRITSYLGQSELVLDALSGLLDSCPAAAGAVDAEPAAAGLRELMAASFPKTCEHCGRVYADIDAFIQGTLASASLPSSGGNNNAVIALTRNCECGAQLTAPYSSRRGSGDLASQCRDTFDALVEQMVEAGAEPDQARGELRQLITGGYQDILRQLKKIAPPFPPRRR